MISNVIREKLAETVKTDSKVRTKGTLANAAILRVFLLDTFSAFGNCSYKQSG